MQGEEAKSMQTGDNVSARLRNHAIFLLLYIHRRRVFNYIFLITTAINIAMITALKTTIIISIPLFK